VSYHYYYRRRRRRVGEVEEEELGGEVEEELGIMMPAAEPTTFLGAVKAQWVGLLSRAKWFIDGGER